MKSTSLAFCVLAISSAPLVGATVVLTVANFSFEDPALSAGNFTTGADGVVPGWSTTSNFLAGQNRGVWNDPVPGKHLDQIAFVYTNNAFAQDLGHAILGNSVYEFTYLFGRTPQFGASGSFELWSGGSVVDGVVVGGNLLASQTQIIDASNFNNVSEYSFTYTSPLVGSPIGETLSVRIANSTASGFVSFDQIRVTGTPVPEPGVFSLLLLAVGAFVARRRRSH